MSDWPRVRPSQLQLTALHIDIDLIEAVEIVFAYIVMTDNPLQEEGYKWDQMMSDAVNKSWWN